MLIANKDIKNNFNDSTELFVPSNISKINEYMNTIKLSGYHQNSVHSKSVSRSPDREKPIKKKSNKALKSRFSIQSNPPLEPIMKNSKIRKINKYIDIGYNEIKVINPNPKIKSSLNLQTLREEQKQLLGNKLQHHISVSYRNSPDHNITPDNYIFSEEKKKSKKIVTPNTRKTRFRLHESFDDRRNINDNTLGTKSSFKTKTGKISHFLK